MPVSPGAKPQREEDSFSPDVLSRLVLHSDRMNLQESHRVHYQIKPEVANTKPWFRRSKPQLSAAGEERLPLQQESRAANIRGTELSFVCLRIPTKTNTKDNPFIPPLQHQNKNF